MRPTESETKMADDGQQPGPSGEKRRRTSKKLEGFVTKDIDKVLGLLEDEDLSALCDTGLSDDSFDEEEETQSEMQRTGGDVDATIAQVVRDNIDREERAELEAECQDTDADPDFEVSGVEGSSASTSEEEGEEGVPVAASATVTRTAGRGADRGRTQTRASARGARRGKILSLRFMCSFYD